MKHLIILLALFITLPTFGAYGGGKKSSITLWKDYCKHWDFTSSYYDNNCWTPNKAIIDKAKAKIDKVITNKYWTIQLFTLQQRAIDKQSIATNPYHIIILQYVIERIAKII